MPLEIFSLRIAHRDIRNDVRQTLEAMAEDFSGNWSVSIIDSQENDSWGLVLRGPDGNERARPLGPGEHTGRAIQTALRELRVSLLHTSSSNRLLKSIQVQNILSFNQDSLPIDLEPLNILIGPNGSGKSNFIEIVGILQEAPKEFGDSIRESGGVKEWLWKGPVRGMESRKKELVGRIEAVLAPPAGTVPIRYSVSFTRVGYQLEIIDERIETERPLGKQHQKPFMYFGYENGRPLISPMGKPREHRTLRTEVINPRLSVLSQVKDPDQYPELTYVGRQFGALRLYREWEFGINSTARDVFAADLQSDHLQDDLRNFGLMLNRLMAEPGINRELLKYLQMFYPDAIDIHAVIREGRVEVQLAEKGGFSTTSSRLPDGTLRSLALLRILLSPPTAPVICG